MQFCFYLFILPSKKKKEQLVHSFDYTCSKCIQSFRRQERLPKKRRRRRRIRCGLSNTNGFIVRFPNDVYEIKMILIFESYLSMAFKYSNKPQQHYTAQHFIFNLNKICIWVASMILSWVKRSHIQREALEKATKKNRFFFLFFFGGNNSSTISSHNYEHINHYQITRTSNVKLKNVMVSKCGTQHTHTNI